MAKKKMIFQIGDVVRVKTNEKDFPGMPCLPARKGDLTAQIPNGTILSISNVAEIGIGQTYYVMEICTGEMTSDLVYVSFHFSYLLEKIPSRRR